MKSLAERIEEAADDQNIGDCSPDVYHGFVVGAYAGIDIAIALLIEECDDDAQDAIAWLLAMKEKS